MSGWVDLHCHLLHGVDDGARTLEDSLEMGRLLARLGFATIAASPHNRPEYAPRALADARREEVRLAFRNEGIALQVEPNAENYFLDERLLGALGTPEGRPLGKGAYLLIEAPYTSPVPTLLDLIFRIKLKGVTPLIAHPERCMEFERDGRAAAAVQAGACLQLDIGALIGRYGGRAKKLARSFLDDGLYTVGATDLHSPVGGEAWVERSLKELRSRTGGDAFDQLMRLNPEALLEGRPLESLPGLG